MGEEYGEGIGERIRQARRTLGMTQQKFAASVGIGQGFLSNIEGGRKLPSKTLLIALIQTHRLDPDWLIGGAGMAAEGERAAPGAAPSEGATTVKAPLLARVPEELPRGGLPAQQYVAVPNLPEGCYAMICHGNFMAPTLRDGDLVILRPDGEKKSGDVVLVNNLWGEPILRRYRIKDEEVYLTADNPAYAPFHPDDKTRIIGVVVDVWRRIPM
ncbi:LexA family protein [Geomesophilobacter sediminis]|uniref:Helix-turn-helix domain-containing protein n=1 Tax=Geomesophilobacter sediminis TaxID=2798584 RepID=A0A8J7JDI4_9BACT|nr:LexA family transcriptional regulator [Geomesophilobacter sediminis]MBJ6723654.1 helix-turn-helix domain-containing protein [Geomesophilobacter sediminis]